MLGVDKIEPLTYKGTSKQDREKLCDAYRTKIYTLADTKANNVMARILSPNPNEVKNANKADTLLAQLRKNIDEKLVNLNNPDDMTAGGNSVCDILNKGYNEVKKNRDFVNFSSKADEETYTADHPVTKVKRMISVFDVWEDFIKGEYAGHGFIFWVIMSILVDIAAFIFFDLAFRKTDY